MDIPLLGFACDSRHVIMRRTEEDGSGTIVLRSLTGDVLQHWPSPDVRAEAAWGGLEPHRAALLGMGGAVVAVSLDGAAFAEAPDGTDILVRDAVTGRVRTRIAVPEGGITALAVAPTHRELAVAGAGHVITIVDAKDGSVLRRLRGHLDRFAASPTAVTARASRRARRTEPCGSGRPRWTATS